MDIKALKKWIKGDEGFRTHPYFDSLNHVTIGWGRNLENGISEDEAQLMFDNDFRRTLHELSHEGWFIIAPLNVQDALINMNFNLGITKLLEFHHMIDALTKKDYKLAAQCALESLWASQIPHRAKEITDMMAGISNEE